MIEAIIFTWNDGFVGKVILLFATAIISIIILILLMFFDSAISTSVINSSGNIISKEYIPAYTTTTFVMNGKVMVPIVIHYPDKWNITVHDYDGNYNCEIEKRDYEQLSIGDYVEFEYKTGFIFNTVYCIGIK